VTAAKTAAYPGDMPVIFLVIKMPTLAFYTYVLSRLEVWRSGPDLQECWYKLPALQWRVAAVSALPCFASLLYTASHHFWSLKMEKKIPTSEDM